MRAALIAMLAVAALAAGCSEDIGSGSYFCGSDSLCPDNQSCDGMTNTCVIPETVIPFSCEAPIVTQMLTGLGCVSPVEAFPSCLGSAGATAAFAFATPTVCTAIEADARVAFPDAFAAVGLALTADADGSVLATDTTCTGATGDGDSARCLTATLMPGASYHLVVGLDASGAGNCAGNCAFNRYSLQFQLDAP